MELPIDRRPVHARAETRETAGRRRRPLRTQCRMLRAPTQCCRLFVRAAAVRGPFCPGRPDISDVERISRGEGAKRRGTGSREVPHRLNEAERLAWATVWPSSQLCAAPGPPSLMYTSLP